MALVSAMKEYKWRYFKFYYYYNSPIYYTTNQTGLKTDIAFRKIIKANQREPLSNLQGKIPNSEMKKIMKI